METTTIKPKRSVKLERSELKRLKEFMKGKTGFEASMEIGIYREVLLNVIARGSGAEKTVNKIREYFQKQSA